MAQAGTQDFSFLITGSDINGVVRTSKILSDGSILIGGDFSYVSGHYTNYIAKLKYDGSVDTSFKSYLDGLVLDIDVDSNGVIWVGGSFSSYNGNSTPYLIKLNSDGTANQLFPNGLDGEVYTIKICQDDKVFIGGGFANYNSNLYSKIIKLNNNGTIDSSFNIGAGFDRLVYDIEIDNDNNILVGGGFNIYDGISASRFIKLNPMGNILTTFGFDSEVFKITFQSDEKILIGGGFTYFGSTYSRSLIRLTKTGAVDVTFDIDAAVRDILIQNDGRIIIGGDFYNIGTNYSPFVSRLNPSGSFDGSWYSGLINGTVYTLSLQINKNILVGGSFGDPPANYLTSLINDESTYLYQYVYEVYSCLDVFSLSTYYVGSNVELSQNDVIYAQNIRFQSQYQCFTISSPTNVDGSELDIIDFFYLQTYEDCISCLSSTTFTATTIECSTGDLIEIPIVISNQYQVGDIFGFQGFINDGIDNIYVNTCLRITGIGLIDTETFNPYGVFNIFNQREVVYIPQQDCESCYKCNGIIYSYQDCSVPEETGLIFSYELLPSDQTFYLPYGSTNCKKIIESELLSFQITDFAVGSHQIYDSCSACTADTSSTLCTWQLCGSLLSNVTGYTLVPNTIIENVNMLSTNNVCGQITGIVNREEIITGSIFLFGDNVEFYSGDCSTCDAHYPIGLVSCDGTEYRWVVIDEITYLQLFSKPISSKGAKCYSSNPFCSFSNGYEIMTLDSFFENCYVCNQPFSAGTESKVCSFCCPCGSTGTTINNISPPHSTWTNLSGKAVVLLDSIELGGINGLNN